MIIKETVINFLENNEGKLVNVELDFGLNFAMVSISSLNIKGITEKQVILSDKTDDPEYLVKSKIVLSGIDDVEEDDFQLEIKYLNGVKVLISVY